jgi:16S rRNA (guanine527-N7)-methyltransferase
MTYSHEIILKYFPSLSPLQIQQFAKLKELYEEWNAKINVISRKDIDNLYLNHVLHSLGVAKIISFNKNTRVLDAGTGGGFPGIPLAIFFPEVYFHLVDSIGKKITVVNEVADALQLKNVEATKSRVEELNEKYDFAISRAVTTLKEFYHWVHPLVKQGGTNSLPNGIICLKGGNLDEEINDVIRLRRRVEAHVYELKKNFEEDFFETKKAVFIS